MTDLPASPRAARLASPRWLDLRLLLGVLLILISVVAGSRILAAADHSQPVWVTTRALAPGAVLSATDLRPGRARLFDNAAGYVSAAGPAPLGYIARRGLGPGELLPREALAAPGTDADVRLVTVPVSRSHLPPDLRAGQQVDVWVTPGDRRGTTATPTEAPRQVLANVVVRQRVRDEGFTGGARDEEPVVLAVRPHEVRLLVAAMSSGQIDLVLVPRQQEREQSLRAVPAEP